MLHVLGLFAQAASLPRQRRIQTQAEGRNTFVRRLCLMLIALQKRRSIACGWRTLKQLSSPSRLLLTRRSQHVSGPNSIDASAA